MEVSSSSAELAYTQAMADAQAPPLRFGDRAADWVAANLGRWAFVIGQTVAIAGWMWTDALGRDPFPWMFLNLALSLQAAYTGPVLLISSNRADATRQRVLGIVERHTADLDRHMVASDTHQTETRALVQRVHELTREVHAMNQRMMVHLQIEVS